MTGSQPSQEPALTGGQSPPEGGALGPRSVSPHVLCDFMRELLIYPVQPAIALTLQLSEAPRLLRKVTYRMYPNAAESIALSKAATAHCKIYNTLLETSRLRHKAGLPAFNRVSVCDAVKAICAAL
jgi:hypothetical protein